MDAVHQIFFSVHIYMYIYIYINTHTYTYDYTFFFTHTAHTSLLNRGFWHLDCAPLSTPGPGGDSTRDMGERHEATMVSNYPTKCINRYKYSKNNARVINVITDMHVIYVYMKYIKILWDTISAHIA